MHDLAQYQSTPPLPPRQGGSRTGAQASSGSVSVVGSQNVLSNIPSSAGQATGSLQLQFSQQITPLLTNDVQDTTCPSCLDNYDELNELDNNPPSVIVEPRFGVHQPCSTLSPSHRSSTLSRFKNAVKSSFRLKPSGSESHSIPTSPRHQPTNHDPNLLNVVPSTTTTLPCSSTEHKKCHSISTPNRGCSHPFVHSSSGSDISSSFEHGPGTSSGYCSKPSQTLCSAQHLVKFTVVRDYIEENTEMLCLMHSPTTIEPPPHSSAFFQPIVPPRNEYEDAHRVAATDPPPPPPKASKHPANLLQDHESSLSASRHGSPILPTTSCATSSSLTTRLKRTSQQLRILFAHGFRRVFLPSGDAPGSHTEPVSSGQKSFSFLQRLRSYRQSSCSGQAASSTSHPACRTMSAFHSPVAHRRCPEHQSHLRIEPQKRRSASVSQLEGLQLPNGLAFDNFIEVINQETSEHELAQRVDPQVLLEAEVSRGPPPLPPRLHRPPPLPPRGILPLPPVSASSTSPVLERIYHDAGSTLFMAPRGDPPLHIPLNNPTESVEAPMVDEEQEAPRTIPTILDNMNRLKKRGWYWGPLTFTEAKTLLMRYRDGTFLLRDSEHETYLLSASFKARGRVFHARIEYFAGEFFLANQPDDPRSPCIERFLELLIERSISGEMHFFTQMTPQPGGVDMPPVFEPAMEDDVAVAAAAANVEEGPVPVPLEAEVTNTRVALLYPLSRFSIVQSLMHLCRFEILLRVRHDHIEQLPLPEPVKRYLRQSQYCADLGLLDCYQGDLV